MSLPGPTRPGSVHPWCDGGAEGGASLRVTLRLMLEVLNVNRRRRPQLEGYVGQEYGGQQYVGIDLHRRRTVVVRTTEAGGAGGGPARESFADAGSGDRPGPGRSGAG